MGIKLKICGLTNLEDARRAEQAGADWLGFIFASSPRRVSPGQAAEIINNLSNQVQTVGVFADHELEEVRKIAGQCNLDYLQLHGTESPDYCAQLDFPVIKAFRVRDGSYFVKLKKYDVDYYLLDTYVPDKLGGTGETFNWELARAAKEEGEVIIAGGLDETNISRAIKMVEPTGVDICSGVESKPGKKDHTKIEKVVEEVAGIGNR